MLLEFRFQNFKSFKDEAVISFVASKDKTLSENLINCPDDKSVNVVRTAAIYGANAAGKSTILDAFAFARNLIRKSARNNPDESIATQPFLLDNVSKNKPSIFEFTFIRKEIRYQYGFAATQQSIQSEWLISYPKGRARKLFDRKVTDKGSKYTFSTFLKGEKEKLVELTHESALFLSVGATFNNPQLLEPYRWFVEQSGFISSKDLNEVRIFRLIAKNLSMSKKIKGLLKFADLGIEDFSLVERDLFTATENDNLPEPLKSAFDKVREALDEVTKDPKYKDIEGKAYNVRMSHNAGKKQVVLPWDAESEGTRRFFTSVAPLLSALDTGRTIFVDELDRSLHPLLVRELIRMFQSRETNPNGAQLVFNTHDTSILGTGLLRRDQVWFLEKDQGGVSHIYSLLEFSPRKDESLEKGYLKGRYGAIPFLGEYSLGENKSVKEK